MADVKKRKHPMQHIAFDERGVIRFTSNKIVRFLLEQYEPGLNDLCARFQETDDDLADYEQLMMLIGYSVSGFGDLDIDRKTIAAADRKAARLIPPSYQSRSAPDDTPAS